MNKKQQTLLKVLLCLFALNSISFYLYFSSHSAAHHRPHLPEKTNQNPSKGSPTLLQKSWPILPSYLPWLSQTSKVRHRSCEAYFGNGFTRVLEIIPPKVAARSGGGWFRCHYSGTLGSSVCEGGKIRMNPGKIRMSRGGERLRDVVGRGEEEELPAFEEGAFQLDGGVGKKQRRLVTEEFLDRYVPAGDILRHTMRELIRSIEIADEKDFDCEEWVEEPTLLVTRFEYANMFHTVTDWYSAYVSSRVTGLPNRPLLVFVDGHCETQLEETWRAMFSGLSYAKNFSCPVCFRHVVIAPLGYETPLFKGLTEEIDCHGAPALDLWRNPDDKKTARLSEFGEMIRASFGFPVNRHRAEKPLLGHNILFVRREDYLAHPRHGGKVESRLSNEQEVFDSLQKWLSNHFECKVNLINGLFAHMSMKEQVRAIQDASVIIGAHGAGLTHMVSALPKTVILEIISSEFRRPHFQLIAQWKGLEYHAVNLEGSFAEPAVVIDKLNNIMKSLGC
ncbi:hypothetical protein SLA2020_300110 [Shorea laevis]